MDATAQASYIGALVAFYTRTNKRTLPQLDFNKKSTNRKKEREAKEAQGTARIDHVFKRKAQKKEDTAQENQF